MTTKTLPDYLQAFDTGTLRKENAGWYRYSKASVYAVIRKAQRTGWNAEIHSQVDGRLLRYAGIWTTLKDAVEEVIFIMRYDK